MKWNLFNSSIGVALGGGAARGIAHIGVLQAFEEDGVNISYISGTSIGALVASYYAFGKSIEEIKAVGKELNFTSVIGLSLQKKGLFSTRSMEKMIIKDLGEVNIEDANIPLAICATDISTGEQVVLRQGGLAKAVCASTAVPGIFVPVEVGGRTLVDGGISENVPISLLDEMGAGFTIGINLNGHQEYSPPKDIISIMSNAIDIAIDLRTRDQLKTADFALSLNLKRYSRMDNSDQFDDLYNEGYHNAQKQFRKLFWYRKMRIVLYLKKLLLAIAPIKIPNALAWWRS
ncbi:MAG: patatin-like phospholipase family protein [Proteobacteria bacterium]|nr:patatin-like phospholipase family protein [Pseudomonadota bacterium]